MAHERDRCPPAEAPASPDGRKMNDVIQILVVFLVTSIVVVAPAASILMGLEYGALVVPLLAFFALIYVAGQPKTSSR